MPQRVPQALVPTGVNESEPSTLAIAVTPFLCYHIHMTVERTTRHSHYNLNYHLVFVPKYRRPILQGTVADRLKELFTVICQERDWLIHSMEVMPDHAHIFLSAPPKWAPSDVAKILKGASARWLLMDYPHLRTLSGHLWTNAFYVGSTGTVSSQVIERYIAAQKTQGA